MNLRSKNTVRHFCVQLSYIMVIKTEKNYHEKPTKS